MGADYPSAREYADVNVARRLEGNLPLKLSFEQSMVRGDDGLLHYSDDSATLLDWR